MKFDDGEYYFLNTTREGYTWEAAVTHMGMYVAWLIDNSLVSDSLNTQEVKRVKSRAITGAQFIEEQCDCKLIDEDLNEDGLAFTSWYYDRYLNEYCRHFRLDGSADALADVANSWDNYELLKPLLDRAFAQWKREAKGPGSYRIHLWRHPPLWRWPGKFEEAEPMLRALQSEPAKERRALTRFVDALAAVDLSHDWSQLERSAAAVASLQCELKDRKPLDAMIAIARRQGFVLHIEEHRAFYLPTGVVLSKDQPQRFRDYSGAGTGANKIRPNGIASTHELAEIACTRWAPTLARYGFKLDDSYKKGNERYTERRFVAESATNLFRVDITAVDLVDSTRCEHPYELGLDLYFCHKVIASTRLKAHYGDAVPDTAKLPSTAFLGRSQWLLDPHGLKSDVEDYLVVNDLPGLDRVIDATTEQFNSRLPVLLECFSSLQSIEAILNRDPIEFSIFYPGAHAQCANHVVAAFLARSPRYVELCDHINKGIDNEREASKGRSRWLRDMEDEQIFHLNKCIKHTASLYRKILEGS
jgi:hypothetical protein